MQTRRLSECFEPLNSSLSLSAPVTHAQSQVWSACFGAKVPDSLRTSKC